MAHSLEYSQVWQIFILCRRLWFGGKGKSRWHGVQQRRWGMRPGSTGSSQGNVGFQVPCNHKTCTCVPNMISFENKVSNCKICQAYTILWNTIWQACSQHWCKQMFTFYCFGWHVFFHLSLILILTLKRKVLNSTLPPSHPSFPFSLPLPFCSQTSANIAVLHSQVCLCLYERVFQNWH